MPYEHSDCKGSDPEREDREREREEDAAYSERLVAADAGLCSRRAALLGGAEYERDLAETMLELREAGCPIRRPVAAAPAAPRREALKERRVA